MMQVNSRAITLSEGCQGSSSREHGKLTRTRLSFPQQMWWHQHYSSRQGFWAGSRLDCSPRERPGMNSSARPPSPASLLGDQSCRWFQQGWWAGSTLETRCHLSLEYQGTKDPTTYLTSCPRVTVGQRECTPVKSHPVSFKPHVGLCRMPGWVNGRVCKDNSYRGREDVKALVLCCPM